MRNTITGFSFVLIFIACRVPQKTILQPQSDVSAAKEMMRDSNNSATLSYQTFIHDKDLQGMIDTVLSYNPDFNNAMQRILYAKAQGRISNAALYPQVNLFPQNSLRKFGLYTMDGAGNIVTDMEKGKLIPINLPDFYLGVQSSWEVDIWGKLKNRKKADMARFLASTETKNLIQTNLIAETSRLFYEWKAAQQSKKLLEETIDLQKEVLASAKTQKLAGQITELAVQQFHAQLKNFEGILKNINVEMINIEAAASILAGRAANNGIPKNITSDVQALPDVNVGIITELIQNRPDIRRAELELKSANFDVAAARAAFYPSLLLNSAAGFQAYRTGLLLDFPASIAYNILGGFIGPVINRGVLKAEYAKASALQKEALNNYESTLNRSMTEIIQLMKTLDELKGMYEAKENETNTLKQSIETATQLFKSGRANYLDILLSRQNALKANMELIDIKKQQFIATINLYRSLGGGWR